MLTGNKLNPKYKEKLFYLCMLFENSQGVWASHNKPSDLSDDEILDYLLVDRKENGRHVTGWLVNLEKNPLRTGKMLQSFLDFCKEENTKTSNK